MLSKSVPATGPLEDELLLTLPYQTLVEVEQRLGQIVSEAHSELQLMQQLFASIAQAENNGQALIRRRGRGKGRSQGDYRCVYAGCCRRYAGESSLQRHIRLKHGSIQRDPPEDCPGSCSGQLELFEGEDSLEGQSQGGRQ